MMREHVHEHSERAAHVTTAMQKAWPLICAVLAMAGCSGSGGPLPGDETCESDISCSDGVFCNGQERCAPSAEDADARGCIVGPAPCDANRACSEARSACLGECGVDEDTDGDGAIAVECGGTDCDDGDANRFPGNREICDAANHDEDCDGSTFGYRDADGDGHPDAACCNDVGGTLTCGSDCDDAAPAVSPVGAELCDGIDNDCDGDLDEGVFRLLYRDADQDGFGDPTQPVMGECGEDVVDAENGLDCDDTNPDIRPGAAELCDGRDTNCDGLFERDIDGDGHLAPSSVCTGGSLPADDCNDLDASTHPDAVEQCDGRDNDCDGALDEPAEADPACAAGDASVALGFCRFGDCEAAVCAVGSGDCDGRVDNGCETDTETNANHCGGCGRACPFGASCVAGLCEKNPVVTLDADGDHTCATMTSGRVVCWGRNSTGGLGNGSLDGIAAPQAMVGIRDAVGAVAGVYRSCALRDGGALMCAGGSNLPRVTEPTSLTLSAGVAVWGGNDTFCERRAGGEVFCTESISFGAEPGVPGGELLSDLVDHDSDGYSECIVTAAGAVRCRGVNDAGQLGDGVADHPDEPCNGIPVGQSYTEEDCSRDFVDVVGLPGPAQRVRVGRGGRLRSRVGGAPLLGRHYPRRCEHRADRLLRHGGRGLRGRSARRLRHRRRRRPLVLVDGRPLPGHVRWGSRAPRAWRRARVRVGRRWRRLLPRSQRRGPARLLPRRGGLHGAARPGDEAHARRGER